MTSSEVKFKILRASIAAQEKMFFVDFTMNMSVRVSVSVRFRLRVSVSFRVSVNFGFI